MTSAITKDITVTQGTTHVETFTIEQLTHSTLPFDPSTNPYIPVDLTGANFAMMVRPTYNSSIVVYTATTLNGAFVTAVDPTTGIVTLKINPTDLNNVKFNSASISYPYNIIMSLSSSFDIEVCSGNFIINRGLTRSN